MGVPKALLTIGEKTFLQHIVAKADSAGISRTVIVLGSDASKIKEKMLWYHGTMTVNECWQEGQLSSILAGLNAVREFDPEGVLIWPVDRPLVAASTIAGLMANFPPAHDKIVVPRYKGMRGHPVLVGRPFFSALERAPADVGARFILWNNQGNVVEYETDDQGVTLNIDTPGLYKSILSKGEER